MNFYSAKGFFLIALSFLTYLTLITHGEFNMTKNEYMSDTYTSMLDHLKKNQYDVDMMTIVKEGFFLNGKVYTYYGPFPAFLRGFIEIFFNRDGKDWARLSCLLAALVTLLSSMAIVHSQASKNEMLNWVFLYTLALGAPWIYLLSTGFIYHESALWAVAPATAFLAIFFRYQHKILKSPFALGLLSTFCGFSFLSKALTALGIVFFQIFYLLRAAKKSGVNRKVIFASLILATLLGVMGKINYEKFGSPLNFIDIKSYYPFLSEPARLERYNSLGLLSPKRIPVSFTYYFLPTIKNFKATFPFLKLAKISDEPATLESFEYFEDHRFGLMVGSPLLFLLLTLGIANANSKRNSTEEKILGGFLFLQLLLSLTFLSCTLRYQTNYYPFILFFSVLGFRTFWKWAEGRGEQVTYLFTTLGVISIYTTMIGTLIYKMDLWSVPNDTRFILQYFLDH